MTLRKIQIRIFELMVGSRKRKTKKMLYKQGPVVLYSKVNNVSYTFTRNKAK